MLRHTRLRANWNKFYNHDEAMTPRQYIATGSKLSSSPEHLLNYKKLYFSLGLDQLALRRAALLRRENRKVKYAQVRRVRDATGYTQGRSRQLTLFYRRIMYHDYYLQAYTIRQVYKKLREYPVGSAVLPGLNNGKPYYTWSNNGINRYTRESLPVEGVKLYEPRKY